MSYNNHFIKVVDLDGDMIIVRPDQITHIVEYQGEDHISLFLTTGVHYEIPRGQISLSILPVHCSHAGVGVL